MGPVSLPLSLVEFLQLLLHCSLYGINSLLHLLDLALLDLHHPLSPLLRPLGFPPAISLSIQLLPEPLAVPDLLLRTVPLLLSRPHTFPQPIQLDSEALQSLSLLL